ncbi:hypothetical protein KSS87_018794 [Heliosperma pusillum]|nr:hypothetical protein KSS87_018794 [Heliosperma pusillum]
MDSNESKQNAEIKLKLMTKCVLTGVGLGLSIWGIHASGLSETLEMWVRKKKKKPIRVYMDGCFDMMHYGHCNALRQARALGDQLVVGVVSDAEITFNKGPPVTPLHERMVMVNAVKWVDEVIPDAPYAITEEFMKKLFDEYNIDYIIHGDDPCLLPDGSDAYALAKRAGRYKQIKRTEGVSSTDIVGRMLLCVRERSLNEKSNHSSLQRQFSHGHSQKFEDGVAAGGTRISHFLPTSRRIVQFSNRKAPKPDSRVIYIDGAFDLFHAGHVEMRWSSDLNKVLILLSLDSVDNSSDKFPCALLSLSCPCLCFYYGSTYFLVPSAKKCWGGPYARAFTFFYVHTHHKIFSAKFLLYPMEEVKSPMILRLAKDLGDFLLVGIHTDQTVSAKRGAHRPIMNLHERSLSVLACRYVDEVIIGAPLEVSKDMIATFNISVVVHGTIAEGDFQQEKDNPYAAAISMGIFKTLESPLDITTTTIIKRIVSNHEAYQKRNEKKGESEKRYYENKTYVTGD